MLNIVLTVVDVDDESVSTSILLAFPVLISELKQFSGGAFVGRSTQISMAVFG